MSSNQKPAAAFILSLLSGIFIIFFSAVCGLWWSWWPPMGWMGGMMREEWQEHMRGWNLEAMAYTMGIVGIIFGIMIIVAAIMLYMNSERHELWGALIIVFSVLSILGCMGGFGIGLIFGIIGGILAVLWKP